MANQIHHTIRQQGGATEIIQAGDRIPLVSVNSGPVRQTDLDMHLVDRIARILFHETVDPKGQEALAWLILNRMFVPGYTTNPSYERTLYHIVTSKDQFEVFMDMFQGSGSSTYDPFSWIAENPTSDFNVPAPVSTQSSWENCLRLAKLLVSAACNPEMTDPETIRDVFESWVPNPFDCDTPHDVCEYRVQGSVSEGKTWEETIGGNPFFIW